jgi:hypothetical protein
MKVASTSATGGDPSVTADMTPPTVLFSTKMRPRGPPREGGATMTTDEASSDGAFSARSSDNGQQYEIIEYDYDQDANIADPNDFHEIVDQAITIDDDSPAAEALRANAKIHVSSVGKAARAVQLQSVRRVLKRATGITKSGVKKGKPPRIPPTRSHQPNVLIAGRMEDGVEGELTDASQNYPSLTLIHEGIEELHLEELAKDGPTDRSDPNSKADILGEGMEPNELDESRNSHTQPNKPKTTLQQQLAKHHVDHETMHIPDGVAPGTVEAGKKGTLGGCRVFRLGCMGNDSHLCLYSSPLLQCFARSIHMIYCVLFGGNEKRREH